MSTLTLDELNAMAQSDFVAALGDVYEHSPWVAEAAWTDRPFESVETLHQRMKQAVDTASRERQLELLRAHPDLGEQTEMTDSSKQEQAEAGLDQLSKAQYETFDRLNETYRDTFDFPFIMAVKTESPDAIETAMRARIDNSPAREFRTALDEVHTIAKFRLDERIEP